MNEIKEVLNYFRMLPKYKGYSYLEDAIQLCREHSEYLTQITKVVYPELAKKYHVTPWSVERNIRTIIDNQTFFIQLRIEIAGEFIQCGVYLYGRRPFGGKSRGAAG